jgi:farnesyl-diphosphate farnesyltransferase
LANLDQLLEATSRTFALSIPLLPDPTRREVTVAYLLFRIADTFEDATLWPARSKIEALRRFAVMLKEPSDSQESALARQWSAEPPVSQAGYIELLSEIPSVLGAFRALRPRAVAIETEHLVRTAEGMAGFVARTDDRGRLQLADLSDLRAYCYVVAGIVGEMLTELFLLECGRLAAIAPDLRERAALFGEGLQLVNVLKDARTDNSEGRMYLPPQLDRSEVFARARASLDAAAEYTLQLQQAEAPRGMVGFCALPVALAWASLEKIERFGPGSKVSRPEVYQIVARLAEALEQGRPALESGGR